MVRYHLYHPTFNSPPLFSKRSFLLLYLVRIHCPGGRKTQTFCPSAGQKIRKPRPSTTPRSKPKRARRPPDCRERQEQERRGALGAARVAVAVAGWVAGAVGQRRPIRKPLGRRRAGRRSPPVDLLLPLVQTVIAISSMIHLLPTCHKY